MPTFPATSKTLWNASATSLFLSLLFCPQTTHADGWSTNLWPSQEHPMEGWAQLQECYSGIVERCQGASHYIAPPSAPTNYLTARTDLDALKSKLANTLVWYLDLAQLSDSAPTYGTTITKPLATYYTVTGLLAWCQMPTNYFTFTPYLGLSGLGALTNDTTVPYPHGFTNATTIAGGTNFPGTRSTWYDTDYGLPGCTNLLAKLTRTYARSIWVNVGTKGFDNGMFTPDETYSSYYDVGYYYSTWTNAKAQAEAGFSDRGMNYPSSDWISQVTAEGQRFDHIIYGSNYYAFVRNMTWHLYDTVPSPVASRQIEFYASATIPDALYQNDAAVFDDQGIGLTAGTNVYLDLSGLSDTTNITSCTFGSTSLPTWCDMPPSSNTDRRRGYKVNEVITVRRWDFKFK